MSAIQQLLLVASSPPAAITWNPSDKDADVTLSSGDLTATLNNTGSVFGGVRATVGRAATENRYYVCEVGGDDLASAAGVAKAAAGLNGIPGDDVNGYGYVPSSNTIYNNGSGSGSYLTGSTVVGVHVDFGAGTITLKRAGAFYTSAFSSISGTLYPMWGPGTAGAGTRSGTLNTGATDFALGLPVGATAWGGTWNSADKDADVTLSGSDLIASTTAAAGGVRGTQGRSSGSYYFEVTYSGADSNQLAGVGNSSANINLYPGSDTNGWAYYFSTNQKYTNNSGAAMPGKKASVLVGVWVNNGDVRFIPDGQVGGIAYTGITGTLFPMWGSGAGAGTRTGTAQFSGSLPWQPAGASAWN